MSQERWTAVDEYITQLFIPDDSLMDTVLMSSAEANLPSIHVSPPQGKFLMLLALICGAKSILEVGTLGGYSTIWLARALPPGGRLITLEIDPAHASVARRNLALAGLARVVNLREGPALETLPKLLAEGAGPFDLIFIDADKPNNTDYFDWAMKLARPGTVIVVDNVVRNGAVTNKESGDPGVRGVRRFNSEVAADPRVSAIEIQTVGSKGYDGFAIALVTAGRQRPLIRTRAGPRTRKNPRGHHAFGAGIDDRLNSTSEFRELHVHDFVPHHRRLRIHRTVADQETHRRGTRRRRL